MSARAKLGLLATALVAALGAWSWRALGWRAARPSAGGHAAAVAAPLAAAPDATPPAIGASALAAGQRQAASAPPVDAAAYPAEIDRERDLHGVVLDPSEAPVPGATVEVFRNDAAGYNGLDLSLSRAPRKVGAGRTDAAGRFAIRVEPGRPYQLEAEADGFARARVPNRAAGERVVVRLARAAALFGRVTRSADGGPVAGAKISAWPDSRNAGMSARLRLFEGSTDADGRFRFEGLAPGDVVVEFEPEIDAAPGWHYVTLAAGEQRELSVHVAAGIDVSGRVTDAATGLPIAGAEVGQNWTFDKPVRTDADGRYVSPGFPEDVMELCARAQGYGRLEKTVRDWNAGTVKTEIDFALLPERVVRGRVIDPEGRPLAGVYAAAVASDHTQDVQRIDWCAGHSDADGRFELRNLRADVVHALHLRREGFGTATYEFPPEEKERAEIELGDLCLARAASARGVVVDERELPVVDVIVTLRGANADGDREDSPALEQVGWYVTERQARTDDLGRFAFADVAPGTYTVESVLRGHRDGARAAFRARADEAVEGLRLVLAEGLVIAGRVTDASGNGLSPVYISMNPEQPGDRTRAASSDVQTDREGRFSSAGLARVFYSLTVWPYVRDELGRALYAPTKVRGVLAGGPEVDLVLAPAVSVRGTVIAASGAPAAGAELAARDSDGNELIWERAGPDGRFELRLGAGQPYELVARAAIPDGAAVATRGEARQPIVAVEGGEVLLQLTEGG